MFAWGDNSVCGCIGLEPETVSPEELPFYPFYPFFSGIKVLAASDNQCFILSEDGMLHSFGTANKGIFGCDLCTTYITADETLNIVDIFAGGQQMFAVTDDGHAYGWGRNSCGQLGLKAQSGQEFVAVLTRVALPIRKKVVQVSCGQLHTLMLMNDGIVYSMGDNSYGQLGLGNCKTSSGPNEILSLYGLPIAQVVAGGWHSFCVTLSGKVFCWGRNNYGQLGLGNTKDRKSPCPMGSLHPHAVKFIDAGDYHSAVLTEDGILFTFGLSDKGQLGHEERSKFAVNPKRILGLEDSFVNQVSCGKRHTIAYVPGSQQLFAWGGGAVGQLGQGSKFDSLRVPTIVKGPWQLQFGSVSFEVEQILASGNQSFVILSSTSKNFSMNLGVLPTHRRIWSLTPALRKKISMLPSDGRMLEDILVQLECIFSSQSCLNASFLTSNHYLTNDEYSGLNLEAAEDFFSELLECGSQMILRKIEACLSLNLLPSLQANPLDIEALRIYLILFKFRLFGDSGCYDSLLMPFVRKIMLLSETYCGILDNWYSSSDQEFFITLIHICQNFILYTASNVESGDDISKMIFMFTFFRKIKEINDTCKIVGFREFYMPELYSLRFNVERQRALANPPLVFSFASYPYVLPTEVKTAMLRNEANNRIKSSAAYHLESLTGLQPPLMNFQGKVIDVYIHRDFLVRDTLKNISKMEDPKQPFRIKFVGEDNSDIVAVRKEYYMLILREFMDPKYGLFRVEKDSGFVWFAEYRANRGRTYRTIGVLCGLSVYSSDIVNINFPLVLFKKLLGKQPTLSDLKEFSPPIGEVLQYLLDFVEKGDKTVETCFKLKYVISHAITGKDDDISLIANGKNTPVTKANRSEYVHAFIDYLFNRSVASQFEEFSEGFFQVSDRSALKLFRPEELRETFMGIIDYDWEELQKNAEYGDNFSADHPVINWFWEVFHSLKEDEKKNFMYFLTGSTKIPVGFHLFIYPLIDFNPDQCLPPTDLNCNDHFLPQVRAFYNFLGLPHYSCKEVLETKLKQVMSVAADIYHFL